MALETLKDVTEIGGFNVKHLGNEMPVSKMPEPVLVDNKNNILAFQIQNGPIKENGVNGCQVDTIFAVAEKMVEGLNEKFSCKQNDDILYYCSKIALSLMDRKEERTERGVEGKNEL